MDSAFIAGLCVAAGLFVTSGHSIQDNIYTAALSMDSTFTADLSRC